MQAEHVAMASQLRSEHGLRGELLLLRRSAERHRQVAGAGPEQRRQGTGTKARELSRQRLAIASSALAPGLASARWRRFVLATRRDRRPEGRTREASCRDVPVACPWSLDSPCWLFRLVWRQRSTRRLRSCRRFTGSSARGTPRDRRGLAQRLSFRSGGRGTRPSGWGCCGARKGREVSCLYFFAGACEPFLTLLGL